MVVRWGVVVHIVIIESSGYFRLGYDDFVGWLVDAWADVVRFGQ